MVLTEWVYCYSSGHELNAQRMLINEMITILNFSVKPWSVVSFSLTLITFPIYSNDRNIGKYVPMEMLLLIWCFRMIYHITLLFVYWKKCIFVAVRQYDLQHFYNCMWSVKSNYVEEENENLEVEEIIGEKIEKKE